MAAKRKRRVSAKGGSVRVFSALEATRQTNPRFNGFSCGHGVHGDTKYNRARENRRWRAW